MQGRELAPSPLFPPPEAAVIDVRSLTEVPVARDALLRTLTVEAPDGVGLLRVANSVFMQRATGGPLRTGPSSAEIAEHLGRLIEVTQTTA